MKIAILGAGALGCYYGAKLAAAGNDVTFIVRSAYEAIKAKGLQVNSVYGNVHLPAPSVCRTPQECGPVDLVIVSWKTCSNEHFSTALPPLLKEGTEVITFQNGMGNAEDIARFVPQQNVYIGLCFVCCMMDEPGIITHLEGGNIQVAPLSGTEEGEQRAAFFAELLKKAGIPARAFRHTEQILWTKLTWNIPFNGLCLALGGISVRQLFTMPEQVKRSRAIMEEVCKTAELRGFPLPMDIVEWQMDRTSKMGDFIPSSAVDYNRRRPVEYEAIWGEPLRRAHAVNAPVPHWEQLAADIRNRLNMN